MLRLDEGQGVALARNRGLAEVSAPWVAFLDDDDVWAPGHLAAMLDAVDAADADPRRIGLVYSGHVEVDWARRVIGISRAAPVAGVPEHLDRFNLIGGPSRVLLRTDAVRAAGGFDPSVLDRRGLGPLGPGGRRVGARRRARSCSSGTCATPRA